jgi:hypothetical protein
MNENIKTEKDFWAEEEKLSKIAHELECKHWTPSLNVRLHVNFSGALEDAESFKGQDVYWSIAINQLHAGLASNLEDYGISAKGLGLNY